jgi:hypothetical protein
MWTRDFPEAPAKGFDSLWQWFWPDNDKQPIVMEIWPNRGINKNLKGWWWNIPLLKPETKLPTGKEKKSGQKYRPFIFQDGVIGSDRRGSGLL